MFIFLHLVFGCFYNLKSIANVIKVNEVGPIICYKLQNQTILF